jgi:hypothetical protein
MLTLILNERDQVRMGLKFQILLILYGTIKFNDN